GRHAHGKLVHARLPRKLFKQREMGAGILVDRRNAHQTLDAKSMRLAAAGHEGHRLARVDTGLLWFKPGIHLDVKARAPPLLRHLRGESGRDLFAIHRLDHVEKGNGIFRLVGLQRPDEMKLDVGKVPFQGRPLGLRFLHAVFAKDALARLDARQNVLPSEGFRDGHEHYVLLTAARLARGLKNSVFDHAQVFGGGVHGLGKILQHRGSLRRIVGVQLTVAANRGEGPPKHSPFYVKNRAWQPNVTIRAYPNPAGRRPGRRRACSKPATTMGGRATTCLRCSPIRRGASTSAISATTRWATWWPATSAPRASMCCTRWGGMRSACRPRMRPCRTRSTPSNGPTRTSR